MRRLTPPEGTAQQCHVSSARHVDSRESLRAIASCTSDACALRWKIHSSWASSWLVLCRRLSTAFLACAPLELRTEASVGPSAPSTRTPWTLPTPMPTGSRSRAHGAQGPRCAGLPSPVVHSPGLRRPCRARTRTPVPAPLPRARAHTGPRLPSRGEAPAGPRGGLLRRPRCVQCFVFPRVTPCTRWSAHRLASRFSAAQSALHWALLWLPGRRQGTQ